MTTNYDAQPRPAVDVDSIRRQWVDSDPEWLLQGRANPELATVQVVKSIRIDLIALLAELGQCRQQLAAAEAKDVYMQTRLTYQCGRADAAESLADTFVEKIKALKAQLAAAQGAAQQEPATSAEVSDA